jgi:nucleoside 2-deoxyribosyltransferase
MKIYVAAKYYRGTELKKLCAELRTVGHEVTSRWILQGEEGMTAEAAALMDLEDVDAAEAVLFIGEPRGSENRGGGRWFELGYAHAKGKKLFVVLNMEERGTHDINEAGHETVFTHMRGIVLAHSQDEMVEILT